MRVPAARDEILKALGRYDIGADPEHLYLEPEIEVFYRNPIDLHSDLNTLVRAGVLQRREAPGTVRFLVKHPPD